VTETAEGPLAGLRVLDLATIFAGPFTATLLGDFGAEVIKVEHPRRGDPLRTQGQSKDGVGLWWKSVSRNKLCVTLDLSKPEGQDILRRLAAAADVLIENFRPGVMERWSLSYADLSSVNPGLVMLRVTGFGQFGPYSQRAGFGTLAEAMSGFAHITGESEGPPTLPPLALADGIAGLAGAAAVMFALRHRDQGGGGQEIDLSLLEPILTVLGNQPIVYDQLGEVQGRVGNRTPISAPRNTYRTREGRWVAVSASADTVAARVLTLVGRPDLTEQLWFATGGGRAEHADELDAAVAAWIAARDSDEVVREFEAAGAAVAPIYDVADVMADPQVKALEAITTVEDEELGPIKMQNVMFRMLRTPGRIRWTGRRLGQDNELIYGRLGIGSDRLDELKVAGVI
jgi:crotonobetainyl-CoA:carnitine CoA-transferase CaiB-like acyl-CoA transferase